jgi:hypothetical protein
MSLIKCMLLCVCVCFCGYTCNIYIHYKEYVPYIKILYNLFLITQKRESWKSEIIRV